MKICSKCGLIKDLTDFNKRKASYDGLNARCKICSRAYLNELRKAEPEKFTEYRRTYYAANIETKRSAALAWKAANPGKANAQVAKRKAQKLKATPAWANQKAIELIYEEAQFCTEFFGIPFHVDHIIPLQSKLVCGLHVEWNLQVILGAENIAKHNRHWPDMPGV